MDELLELDADKKLEYVLKKIKELQTNDEIKKYIISLPDNLKIRLIDIIKEVYIEPEIINGNREARRDAYEFSIVDSISDDNIIKFLKEKNNRRYIIYFIQYTTRKDDIKLRLFDLDLDFSCRLLIAASIEDREIRINKLRELNVPEIFIEHTEERLEEYTQENGESLKSEYGQIGILKVLTFGIEIEGVNINYAEGLKQRRKLFNILKDWICKGDYTIEEGNTHSKGIKYGLEVVSPILRDSKQAKDQIVAVCNMLQELGTTINEKCGGHIHFGIDFFKTPKELWNLIELYGVCDEVFMLMSNEPGILPRNSLRQYAQSTYKLLKDNNINVEDFDNIEDFIQKIQELQAGKNYDINISDKGTVEFRVSNSTVKSKIWLENIFLYGKLMEIARLLEEKNINSSDEKRVIYARLQDNIDIHERCELLLQLLFDDENEKKLFRERFTTNLELQIGVEQYRKLYLSQELSLDSLRKKSKEELDKK